ncbi:MAG: SGNH/GDSL hydrolase family protein, partial [Verrucomicrobiales bacterium]
MRGFLLLMAVAGGLLMGVLGRTQEASVLPSDTVPASSAGPGESEDNPNPGVLTAQQRERLKGFIPRTFRKLERRDRVHIVALGDNVTRVYTPVPDTSEDFIEGYVAKFGTMLAKRFFYTGGVRMVNAPKGKRQKWDEHLGKEIQVENLAVGGRTAVDALQYLTTTAFLNDPDLVLVNYGINDSKQNLSLDTYRRSLSQVVEECRRRGVDVIVMAPNLIRGFPEPVEWGLTRPYATVAEEVAAENSVFFMDFGKYTASLGGAVPANYESEAAITQVSDRLHTMFHFEAGKPDDDLHPNHETQKFMGSALYENLVNETKATAYKVTAKAHARGEEVVVTLTVRSQVEEDRQVHLCALPVGHWLTATSTNHSFLLAAGKKQEIELIYRTPGQPGSGALEVSTDLG